MRRKKGSLTYNGAVWEVQARVRVEWLVLVVLYGSGGGLAKKRCVFSFSARAESNFSRSFRMMYSSSLHSVLRPLGQKAKDFFFCGGSPKAFFLVRPLNGEV